MMCQVVLRWTRMAAQQQQEQQRQRRVPQRQLLHGHRWLQACLCRVVMGLVACLKFWVRNGTLGVSGAVAACC
jgi:hypothetical protein